MNMAYTSRFLKRLVRQGLVIYRNGCNFNGSKEMLSRNFTTSSSLAHSMNNLDCYNLIVKYDKNSKASRRLFTLPFESNSRYGLRSLQTSRGLLAQEPWMISDYEVNAMISAEESSGEIKDGIVERFEANHLASNSPIEDRKFIAKLLHEDGGYLFGVLDGHGGDGCARSVCQRMANYIALSLLKPEVISELDAVPKLVDFICMSSNEYNDYNYIDDPVCQSNFEAYFEHLQRNPGYDFKQYRSRRPHKQKVGGLQARAQELLDSQSQYKAHALTNAYLTLDEDISQEALTFNENGEVDKHLFDAANAGACALVAHLNGTELCIANTGDCRAVLGVENLDKTWSAIQLTSDHTAGWNEHKLRVVFV